MLGYLQKQIKCYPYSMRDNFKGEILKKLDY